MANNGAIGSHMYNQQNEEQPHDYVSDIQSGLFSAWQRVAAGAAAVKQKSDETGLTDNLKQVGSKMKSGANQAIEKAGQTYEKARESETGKNMAATLSSGAASAKETLSSWSESLKNKYYNKS